MSQQSSRFKIAIDGELHLGGIGFGLGGHRAGLRVVLSFTQRVCPLEFDQALPLFFERLVRGQFLFLDVPFLIDRRRATGVDCFVRLAEQTLAQFGFERLADFRRGSHREEVGRQQLNTHVGEGRSRLKRLRHGGGQNRGVSQRLLQRALRHLRARGDLREVRDAMARLLVVLAQVGVRHRVDAEIEQLGRQLRILDAKRDLSLKRDLLKVARQLVEDEAGVLTLRRHGHDLRVVPPVIKREAQPLAGRTASRIPHDVIRRLTFEIREKHGRGLVEEETVCERLLRHRPANVNNQSGLVMLPARLRFDRRRTRP